jgi:undecaprenyl-diphosphatase
LGWDYAHLPDDVRKAFEVALHAGSAPVLAVAAGRAGGRHIDPVGLALTLLPPALAGLVLERPIERRLGGPASVGAAQVAAGAALLLADRRPARRETPTSGDQLAVGLAQALALVPGVSRSGAALTAGRLRGLSRPAALRLALAAALPVTVSATALKGLRVAQSGALPRAALAGATAALVSSAVALPLVGRLERADSWAPLAGYRIAVGALALAAARSA